ncbi:MAG: IS110 family transposase [Panacagrimonas sp.]
MDLHKAFFQACAVSPTGDRLWEGRFPRTPAGLEALTVRCTRETALAVEASTPTWHFADGIVSAVGDLRIVDPLKTKLKAGYAAKTDRLDARRLADALRRDSVVGIYYPPLAIRELRELCRSRHALVQVRTALINRLRAVLLRQGLADARRLSKTADDAWLTGLALPPRAAASVATLRQVLAVVRTEVGRAEAEVRRLADADPIGVTLQQLRGIGPVLALTIRAEIGDIRRFATGAQLASYAGVVPRVDMSAGHYRYGRITRRGSPWLRWALIEAAIHGTTRTDRIGRWGRGLAVRKGALKARVALARVLCAEIHRLWLRIA